MIDQGGRISTTISRTTNLSKPRRSNARPKSHAITLRSKDVDGARWMPTNKGFSMNQSMITLITVLITALSTLGGVLITSLINSSNTRLSQESEERKHHRDLLFKTAIEYWQAERKELPHLPLEQYIVSMDAFYTVFMEENPDGEKVQKKMAAREIWLAKRA